MSLRVATFFPFTIACFLNGHSFLAQELVHDGVSFRKDDNAFLNVADVAALQSAAERLTPAVSSRLTDSDYRLGQLRYDLTKLWAKGLVERLGTTRRYRLTRLGLKLGVLLVKLRLRLLGPLGTLAVRAAPSRPIRNPSQVEAAFRQVDTALDHLCDTLGLAQAA